MTSTDLSASSKHLYHPFRQKIARVLEDVTKETGEPWIILEGYRSPERQTFLWQQGRTRPGRIVMDHQTPRWHGAGLAAHLHPKARPFAAPMSLFQRLRGIYLDHGLDNPYWGTGNRAHVQMGDNALRIAATQWVRDGFPAGVLASLNAEPRTAVRVLVEGQLISDADAYCAEEGVYTALRPIADAFDWVILGTGKLKGVMKAHVVSDRMDLWIPVVNGFISPRLIPVIDRWDGMTHTLHLSEKA